MFKKAIYSMLFAFGFLLVVPATVAAATNVVSTSDLMGWLFFQETGTTGSAGMVFGPETAPLGYGSANFKTGSASDGWVLGMAGLGGTKLTDLTKLEYSTFVAPTSTSTVQVVALQVNVDDDVTDADDTWKGRLVFEPYYSEVVTKGTWQTWDTLTQGKWWGTGSAISAVCSISSPCTYSEVVTAFPNIGMHNVYGAVLFKAGSGWPAGFDGNVDTLTVGTAAGETTYDFEPDIVMEEVYSGGGQLLEEVGPKRKDWHSISFGGNVSEIVGSEIYMGTLQLNFHNVGNDALDKTKFHGEVVKAVNTFPADSATCNSAANVTFEGTWEGIPGYSVILRLGDSGSPNVGDTVRVQVFDPSNVEVYDTFDGDFTAESSCVGTARTGLDKGNITLY